MKRLHESILSRSLDDLDNEFGEFLRQLSKEDRIYVRNQIFSLPKALQIILINQYKQFKTQFEANTFIRKKCDALKALLPAKLYAYFDATESELRILSEECAEYCKRIDVREKKAHLALEHEAKRNINQQIYGLCSAYTESYGIAPPEFNEKRSIRGSVKRMQDQYWWLKRLRKVLIRKREAAMILLGQVNNLRGKYCSDLTLHQRILQKARQDTLLDNLVMINDLNEEIALREVFEANVSNPVNRRYELMTRMNGFEKLSKELGHIALFVTVTCPSKYHNSYAKSGDRNPKWNESSPYDAQQYLNSLWRKTRAELARHAIQQYGFRIAEPQHDGTPHWHLLIFIEPKHKDTLIDIYTHYAMEEDGAENGAAENRITFVDIDPQRGSATGYVAKYVSKNIDGGGLDSDIDGGDATEAARRVEAWASCWGIRQFQQLGNTSVTVWREMRRLKKAKKESDQFQAIHKAADEGNWAEFVTTMGGVMCKRDEMAIRPYYDITIDSDTGEVKQSYFDEEPTVKIKGLKYEGKEIITREHSWRIERRQERAA